MDKLTKYSNHVHNIINKYGSYRPAHGDIEVQTICDEKNEHHQVLNVGLPNNRRVYDCSLHIDIKNNKITDIRSLGCCLYTRPLRNNFPRYLKLVGKGRFH